MFVRKIRTFNVDEIDYYRRKSWKLWVDITWDYANFVRDKTNYYTFLLNFFSVHMLHIIFYEPLTKFLSRKSCQKPKFKTRKCLPRICAPTTHFNVYYVDLSQKKMVKSTFAEIYNQLFFWGHIFKWWCDKKELRVCKNLKSENVRI